MEKSPLIIDSLGIRKANQTAMEEICLRFLDTFSSKNSTENLVFQIEIDGADNFVFEKFSPMYSFAMKKTQKNPKIL